MSLHSIPIVRSSWPAWAANTLPKRCGGWDRSGAIRSSLPSSLRRCATSPTRFDIFDVCVATRHKKAKEALETYQQQIADTTDAHSQLLYAVGRLVLDDSISNPRLRPAIYGQIPREQLQGAVEEARTLRRPQGHLDFLSDHYSYLRQFVPQFLAQMPFTSHQKRDLLLAAIEVIRTLDATDQRQLPAKPPLGFVPPRWRRFVLAQKPPARRAYELCVLSTLRDALRAGNIYLPTSRRYADPETYLIPHSDWPQAATRNPGTFPRLPLPRILLCTPATEPTYGDEVAVLAHTAGQASSGTRTSVFCKPSSLSARDYSLLAPHSASQIMQSTNPVCRRLCNLPARRYRLFAPHRTGRTHQTQRLVVGGECRRYSDRCRFGQRACHGLRYRRVCHR